MKRIKLLNMLVIIWQSISCLSAPRDNIYDPKNPDKSTICGYLYEPDSLAAEGAIVNLVCNDSTVLADTSNSSGFFMLEGIEPAIYKITADAEYYGQLVFEAESLWAGTNVNDFNLVFSTFDFEDDEEYTKEPYGFQTVCGNWQVNRDIQNPGAHSIPNVYTAICDSQSKIALSLFRSRVKNYNFQIKFKIPASPDTQWCAGIVLGYQNIYNFYILEITPKAINFKHVIDSISTIGRTDSISLSVNTWHSIENSFDDGIMTFHLNGEWLFQVLDNSFSDGYIGLWAVNLQDEITSEGSFDDVTIHPR